MSKYPEVVTAAQLDKLVHITDAEIARDIADTEKEIMDLQRTMEAEQTLAETHHDPMQRKMADFTSRARPSQMRERQDFVDYLRRVQTARVDLAAHASQARSER